AEDLTVGAREVHVLEDALSRFHFLQRRNGALAVQIDGDDLATLDFTLQGGAKQIEGAALGSEDRRITKFPHDQWSPAAWVAGRQQRIADDDDEAVGSFDALQRIGQTLLGVDRGGP